jgi:hypothetical protein
MYILAMYYKFSNDRCFLQQQIPCLLPNESPPKVAYRSYYHTLLMVLQSRARFYQSMVLSFSLQNCNMPSTRFFRSHGFLILCAGYETFYFRILYRTTNQRTQIRMYLHSLLLPPAQQIRNQYVIVIRNS